MNIIEATLVGVVQGVSEWLPISSKTQIMFAAMYITGAPPAFAYSLGLFLEAASVLAALLYFRSVYLKILRGLLGDVEGRRWLTYVAITTLVTAAVGVPLYLVARQALAGGAAGWLMTALGVAIVGNAVALRRAHSASGLKSFSQMTLRDMAIVGLAQALSVLPGVSRSGATTSVLLLLGYAPAEAFKASFVLVPVAGLGAATLAYLAEGSAVVTTESLIAMAVGVVVSLVTIEALLKFARSRQVFLVNLTVGALAIAGGLLYVLGR